MKFFSVIVTALLPLAVLSTPLQGAREAPREAIAAADKWHQRTPARSRIAVRDAEAESARIHKRAVCDIVHVVTTVDCWNYPTHGHESDGNYVIKHIPGDTKNIHFACYARCENVHGITAWYLTSKYNEAGCYVPGYYTDDNCRSTGSNALPRCPSATSDENAVGC
ncbi:hypothetical protein B0O99DRAFT_746335 [Bisporella sp. PMI_857]|nr:hypothetical protein B0O99DRAFT_746335 [Bisporella sp. PMI_857]